MTTRRFLCLPVDLSEDPRTLQLCASLQCDHAEIYLIRLWNWAVRQSPDGMIGVYDDRILATAARWSGEPSTLISAIRAAGYLEGEQLTDWPDLYRVESARADVRQRVAKHRAAKRNSTGNVTETEFSLSLNSKINSRDHGDRGSGGKGPLEREIPPLCDPWWTTDEGTFRAYLLAIPGPDAYLALPDPREPTQDVLRSIMARFPAFDGSEGRPTVQERAQATWDALRGRLQRNAGTNPFRALIAWTQWIGDGHDRLQQTRRRSGSDDLSLLASSFGRSTRPVS